MGKNVALFHRAVTYSPYPSKQKKGQGHLVAAYPRIAQRIHLSPLKQGGSLSGAGYLSVRPGAACSLKKALGVKRVRS